MKGKLFIRSTEYKCAEILKGGCYMLKRPLVHRQRKELGQVREGLEAGRYEICDHNILLWRHLASKLKINNLCCRAFLGLFQHLFGRAAVSMQLSVKRNHQNARVFSDGHVYAIHVSLFF